MILVGLDIVWVLASVASGFPGRLETIFQTIVAASTLALVFVIQHTQAREQVATQRKLDEILRSVPDASNALITVEDAPDHEVVSTHRTHRQLRQDAVDSAPG